MDPSQPVVDLDPMVETLVDGSQTRQLPTGKVTVRFPESCRQTLGPIVDAIADGMGIVRDVTSPGTLEIDSTIVVLDNRDLPPNVEYSSPGNTTVVLAPRGCQVFRLALV
jgi:hypothetical protein